jgi:hypothetical protein
MADGSSVLLTTLAALVFVCVAIVGPGLALQRLLRLRVEPALVIPAGLVLCAGFYWISLVAHLPWLFPVLALGLDLALSLPRGRWQRVAGPSLSGAMPAFVAVVALFAATQYRLNRIGPDGTFALDSVNRVDTAFHVSLTWELVAGYPPQVPGLSGVPLGYHIGTHLARAAATRWAGIHPYDSMYRFDITLWALALILALRAAARALGAGQLAVALVAWAPLATDLSFLWAAAPGAHWWATVLSSNLLLSLFFANSSVSGLLLALGALVAYSRHRAGEGRAWLAIAALLGLALPFFKIFHAALFLAGVGVAWLSNRSRRDLLLLVAPCFVATLALALGQGGETVLIFLDPLGIVRHTRAKLGLPPLASVPFVAWSALWLIAALGLRCIGIPAALRSLVNGAPERIVAATMALLGWPLGLLVHITADRTFNESAYFVEASGLFLWLFAAEALAQACTRRRWLLVIAAGLALPSTVQFVLRKVNTEVDVIPANVVRAMRVLARESRVGDVVLMRPHSRYPPPPLVLAGRRIPDARYIFYRRQFASPELLEARDREVRDFFQATRPAQALAIARDLHALYVYLTEDEKVDFDRAGVLVPLYVEGSERVYRIVDSEHPWSHGNR